MENGQTCDSVCLQVTVPNKHGWIIQRVCFPSCWSFMNLKGSQLVAAQMNIELLKTPLLYVSMTTEAFAQTVW